MCRAPCCSSAPLSARPGRLESKYDVVQAVNSITGQLTDAWNLTKPVGWVANSTNQTDFISNFFGNYTPTEWCACALWTRGLQLAQPAQRR